MVKISIDVKRGIGQTVFVTDAVAWKVLQALKNIDTPPPDASLEEVKRWHYQRAYRHANGKVIEAARTLGVSTETVYIHRRAYKLHL